MAAISGNTGNVSGNGIVGNLNTWSATISRAVSDVTGFNNSGRNRILGVYDLTGSAGGIMDDGSSLLSSSNFAAFTSATGANVILTADSGNAITAACVVSDIALGSSKAGDATITFSFSLASTVTTGTLPFTIAWS
jgi:hypothetical protein